jgi:hypothetical protein
MSSTNYLQPERRDNSRAEIQKYFTPDFCLITTDVTQNADDESPAASQAGQPRGDGDYLKNSDSVRATRTGRSPKPRLPQEFYLRRVS